MFKQAELTENDDGIFCDDAATVSSTTTSSTSGKGRGKVKSSAPSASAKKQKMAAYETDGEKLANSMKVGQDFL